MKYKIRKSCLLVLLAILTLSGCNVGPKYERPETAADEKGFVNAEEKQAELEYEAVSWWVSFGDETTNALVEKALENNKDLQSAALTVLQSEALLKSSSGRRLPGVDYNGKVTRSRSVTDNVITGDRQGIYSTNYDLGISVSYVADIFGKLKRGEKAAIAELWSSQATKEALEHAIIAQVIKARIQISQLHGLLAIAQDTTKSWKKSLDTIEKRYERGLLQPEDLHLARENYAANQSNIPELQQQLALAYNSLDVLLGQKPGSTEQFGGLERALPNLEKVPVGMPATLLDRRPDLRAAEFRVMAANEKVGASIAALYPDLTFTASGGLRDDKLSDLLDWENRVYSLIAGITGPLFKGGALKADVKLKKAQMEQASVQYAGTVLKALREVEDALVKENKLQETLSFSETRIDEANKAEQLATDRYLNGANGSFLKVLEIQRRRQAAQNQLVQIRSNIWSNRVDLYLALGGSWNTDK
ncbi:MAG: efflux transporter outer membrane subunit [Phycisphaerae bacterium]|nr:efflux transporter outer membrane subunit [Phycisphaerae bacterium]